MTKRPLLSAFLAAAVIVAVFAGAYLMVGKAGSRGLFDGKVGVVPLIGGIKDPSATLEALDKFRRDDSIKAVVLRVNSSGGGAAASQEIYREVRRTALAKPVVASFGEVAASGGYYAACPASKIMASEATITGSIGVIMALPDMKKLLETIGVKLQVVKAGQYKATGMPDRPLSPEERAMLQAVVDQVRRQFVKDVARARSLSEEKVDKLATGGIITGQTAKEVGLVDEMGNFSDAITLAARLGGIKGRPELVWPDNGRRPWWVELFKEEARSLLQGLLAEFMAQPGLMFRWLPPGASSRPVP